MVRHLDDDEIEEFVKGFDRCDHDGYIYYENVKHKLAEAYDELAQRPDGGRHAHSRDAFVRSVMGPDEQRIARDSFAARIREKKIPSLRHVNGRGAEEKSYFERRPDWRRMRAYWAVHGPEVLFLGLVFAVQAGLGAWQFAQFSTRPYIDAFGWGVAVAKACAGALYPAFFFLMLGASRYLSTLLRRFYHLSRFCNWDLSRRFHVRISCVALVLVAFHALGHLAGTFVHGSRRASRESVAKILGAHRIGGDGRYVDFLVSVPGLTGLAALGLFCLVALLSIPAVRRRHHNVFQLGHLLVYPLIGLVAAHGSAALLQQPIFGYFLAFPTFLLLFERLSRIFLGLYRVKASLEVETSEIVKITAVLPRYRLWDFTAGQYIFLQVPLISFFQWHPFTISVCCGKSIILRIKTDGDWTAKLRRLGPEIEVGINGPFGAPAQRFHDFEHSVVIGAGIGITPYSAILADLQHEFSSRYGTPGQTKGCRQDMIATI
ncbi:hypothetical protein CDD83_177 [Cordyceps sp. RAO-2017]|nr:hypothetical protein CDD83_177 [Cordyceps sp. RAO-2017]